MNAILVLLAVLQGGVWSAVPVDATVGDTVFIERSIPAPPGATARTRTLERSELIEPLGPAVVTAGGAVVLVRHRVALFAPGRHRLPMPAIELVAPDGHVEWVAGDTAIVDIVSLLPDTGEAPPRWSRAPLARPVRRIEPLVFLVGGVLLSLGAWAVARRRTRPRPAAPPEARTATELPVARWLSAGEGRAVASLAAERLRVRIEAAVPAAAGALGDGARAELVAAERPEWPIRELEDVLLALERARFAPLVRDDAIVLADRVEVLLQEIDRLEGEEEVVVEEPRR